MSRSKAKELIEKYASLKVDDSNEAETRKKLIDKVLEDVLGWNDDDISYEERVSEDGKTRYSDYIIRTANVSFLIEAKRVGVSFYSVPSGKKQKLCGQIMEGETGDAIKQARDYCRKKAIPFAVVTNGWQWLIFAAVRTDQVSFADSTVIVFNSLEQALLEEYEKFSMLLSRNGVIDGNLSIELIGRNTDQIEERRLNKFFSGHANKTPNPIYPLIEHAVLTAFSDSISEGTPELLEKCYVKNADRLKFDSKIQMHLNRSEPLFNVQPKRPMRKQDAGSLKSSIESSKSNKRPLAILILGTVGAGKTTFLKYTRKVSATEYFNKKPNAPYPHWIDIDFLSFSKNENPIKYIYKHLFEYIKNDDFFQKYERSIKHAYKKDIESLKNGPMFLIAKNDELFTKKISEIILSDYEKIDPYVDKLMCYASTLSPIFLVIDNVDQFEDESVQANIFADAMALANRLGFNLILAMRESTYISHRSSPTFDAFDFDPLHIDPPEIPAVLSGRFFLASQLLVKKQGEFVALNGATFKVSDLSEFMEIIKQSVLGTEIGSRIDVLSNHDVRLALRMTREFLAKGYTDPAKAITTYRSNGTYTLPKQEAFRSILLGNHSVYKEEYSVIGNPFDSRLGRANGELLRLFTLSALVRMSSENGVGYLDGPIIRDRLNSIGYSENDTIDVLKDLCRIRFIHTASHGEASIVSNYYPSRLGGHIIRNLIADFTFVENVMMDTFISSKIVWDKLKELSQKIQDQHDIVSRLKLRAEKSVEFYNYMEELYSAISDESKRRGLDSIWLSNPLTDMKPTFKINIETAIQRAESIYGNRGAIQNGGKKY